MALINVKKKIEKARETIGLDDDEVVLAACTTNPAGTVKRMMARELGGAIGSAVAGRDSDGESVHGGAADAFVDGQHFVALTDKRLLLVKVGTMTGKAKELLAAWPRDEVAAIVVDDGRMALPFTIAFTDGTAVGVEGAKGTDPRSVATAFDQLA